MSIADVIDANAACNNEVEKLLNIMCLTKETALHVTAKLEKCSRTTRCRSVDCPDLDTLLETLALQIGYRTMATYCIQKVAEFTDAHQ